MLECERGGQVFVYQLFKQSTRVPRYPGTLRKRLCISKLQNTLRANMIINYYLCKKRTMSNNATSENMTFESLVGRINLVQDVLQAQAAHAVNLSLTARNWLVGYYIVEFEQHGEDRAKYGEKLINRLAERINRKGFEPRSLRVYRRVYIVYPQLGAVIGDYLQKNVAFPLEYGNIGIWQSLIAKFQITDNQSDEIWRSALAKLEDWSTPADRMTSICANNAQVISFLF